MINFTANEFILGGNSTYCMFAWSLLISSEGSSGATVLFF